MKQNPTFFEPPRVQSLAEWEAEHKGHTVVDSVGEDDGHVVRLRRCYIDGQMFLVSMTEVQRA